MEETSAVYLELFEYESCVSYMDAVLSPNCHLQSRTSEDIKAFSRRKKKQLCKYFRLIYPSK